MSFPRLLCLVVAAAALGRPADADLPRPAAPKGLAVHRAAAERTHGALSALVIFAKFRGEAPGDTLKPAWADDLFNPNRPGSFTHFYDEMSRGQLQVTGAVLPRRYSSLEPASAYVAAAGVLGQFGRFNLQILRQADAETDLGRFDNDGPDGAPNSGDDDGYVDVVFINLLTVPEGFFIGKATGYSSLGLETDYLSDDPAAGGGTIRVRSRFSGFGGTTQRGHVYTVTAGTMCHEFGHVLGLPDLFDQSAVTASNQIDPAEDSAGIGKWGLMGLGTLGWGVEDGPNAFCAWTLMTLGWLGRDNELLEEVTSSQRGVVIEPIDRGGKVYKVPVSPDEYFLIENRQSTGSYYNRNVPGSGLLLWHVDERADNDEEHHKQVDLVCADGLYADRGYPGAQPDPVAGGDNLDFYSSDGTWAAAHNGNTGDATDAFDGVRFARFAYDTNPGARTHTGATRNLPVGFALESIRALANGRMQVDILVRQPLDGHVSSDTTWSGRVDVDGDVVVEPGATLTLRPGTEVRFALGDSRASGFDAQRGELIAYGGLVVEGDAASPVVLRSARSPAGRSDWGGLLLMSGQAPGLEDLQASGGLVVQNAQYGLLRSRLPAGTTTWSGQLRVPWDVVVPAGARLEIAPGTAIRYATEDLGYTGLGPPFVELVVEGEVRAAGEAGQPVTMTVDAFGQSAYWYGVILRSGGRLDADFLQISQAGYGVAGEVSGSGALVLRDGTIQAPINGLRLTVFGAAALERTRISDAYYQGVRVEGSGWLRVRGGAVSGSGQEGVWLGNCNLELADVQLADNGGLDAADPRSGLAAQGGRGQQVVVQGGGASGNSAYGLDLGTWQGAAAVADAAIATNRRGGLRANGPDSLSLDRVRLTDNQGVGAALGGGPVRVSEAVLSGNTGLGLQVQAGTTGSVEGCTFQAQGLRVAGATEVKIQANTFQGAALALESLDASPEIVRNRFAGNGTALKVSGPHLPSRLAANAFIDNRVAVQNLAAARLDAAGNFWGTVDPAAIAALVSGQVTWSPFLEVEPAITAVAAADRQPPAFALYPSYPNPFNASAVIAFDLADARSAQLTVYDALGRAVRILRVENPAPGRQAVRWDGRDEEGRPAASGVYPYRLVAGDQVAVGRMLLLR
ncbi:MAG: FlgD immunoglobulin-like domain containing protein [Gemmatimonadota bacterium]